MVKGLIPFVDLVRFVNSGTEAVMSAIRLARGVTGRDKIVKFSGCYHGHADSLLVEAGSGLATFGLSSSAGVPSVFAEQTIVVPLDDEEAINEVFEKVGEEIACIIIEPLPANNGLLVQRPEFLSHLRQKCDEEGALLIFDEVISGFRFASGTYGSEIGVIPDIITLGKVIGGGLPVGAYAANYEIMSHLAPLGPVYQAGTLSGNPLAMAAGIATIKNLVDNDSWTYLEKLGDFFDEKVNEVLGLHDNVFTLQRVASIFWFSLGNNSPPRCSEDISFESVQIYADLHASLLEQGIMLAPSSYEVGFLSTAHNEQDILEFVSALDIALKANNGEE